jgi:hypothetical protein
MVDMSLERNGMSEQTTLPGWEKLNPPHSPQELDLSRKEGHRLEVRPTYRKAQQSHDSIQSYTSGFIDSLRSVRKEATNDFERTDVPWKNRGTSGGSVGKPK